MDLQSLLNDVVRALVRSRDYKLQSKVYLPSAKTLQRYIVTIHGSSPKDDAISSSGNSLHLSTAVIKSLGELAETVSMLEQGISHRSGMAAGFFKNTSLDRAKAEVIERDAFLYHYSKKIPFLKKTPISGDLVAFALASGDPSFLTSLVTTRGTVDGNFDCLQFGIGTAKSEEISIEKAIQEYSNIRMNHQLWPDRCMEWHSNPKLVPTIMDMHHVLSRDIRNKEIFNLLFKVAPHTRTPIKRNAWHEYKIRSSIRFFSVYRVSHPELRELTFGIPEEGTRDLFHPFW